MRSIRWFGAEKQIDDALGKGDPVIITEPDGGETKVGRDCPGKVAANAITEP